MAKGKLIVIEGGDGTGKTVQADLVVKRRERDGHVVRNISFPRYDTPTGKVVRHYLDGEFGDPLKVDSKLASAFYAADRKAAEPLIESWQVSGEDVLANRYAPSNMAHQGAKFTNPDAQRDFIRWEDEYEYGKLGIPRPDLVIILHLPAEVGQRRANRRDDAILGAPNKDGLQASLPHLKAAEQAYLEIARLPNHVLIECTEEDSPETIHERVWAVLHERLGW
jgi:dTMP kinase